MKSSTALKGLVFAEKPNRPSTAPIQSKRSKLLERLNEQREMVSCMLSAKPYQATKEKVITDEDGNQKTVTVPKRVKEWFYCVSDKWYFEVRYGNRLLELAAGKPVIEVSKKERLVGVIDTVIKATESGELDELLSNIKRKRGVAAAATGGSEENAK